MATYSIYYGFTGLTGLAASVLPSDPRSKSNGDPPLIAGHLGMASSPLLPSSPPPDPAALTRKEKADDYYILCR